jgi:hypothetical protein
MFDQVYETFRQATETALQMQQEMVRKWVSLWVGMPAAVPPGAEQVRQFQKKWAEFIGDLIKRQREVTEAQLQAGLEGIEKAFHLGEAKNIEELRARTFELWQKCFEGFRQGYEAQVQEFQRALEKWMDLVSKPAA